MTSEERIQIILGHLHTVHRERLARQADASFAMRATAVRTYQAHRFRRTYSDLLAASSTCAAAEFFLNELYGTQDFLERDAQFQRIVPTLVHLFSADVAETVALLAELHAISEDLDSRMARCISDFQPLTDVEYATAWRQVGEPGLRERQIDCVGRVGASLVRYTTHPTLGRALRMMRLPARAAGLKDLQSFLERGFETFGALKDPASFISTVQDRERELARELFCGY